MKITRCTLSQEHWYCCTRKPTICPYCGEKGVRKSIFGYPSQEDFYSKKYHLQGCCPDFPRPRDWGCVNCDAAFFKEKESSSTQHILHTLHQPIMTITDQVEEARAAGHKTVNGILKYAAKNNRCLGKGMLKDA